MVLPSADRPHLLSTMRFTMPARCVAESAFQSAMLAGLAGAAVVVGAAVDEADGAAVVADVVELLSASFTPDCTPLSTVLSGLAVPSPPLLPQAARAIAAATNEAVTRRDVFEITLPPYLLDI